MKTKLSSRFWLCLTIFSLMGQIAWVVENMYFNVFIYKMFNASAADISSMVTASAVTATLTTVLMGPLSDKLGKRKLFICGGYLMWGISIFSFIFLREDVISKTLSMTVSAATVGVSLTIILDCVMTFFGSTANDAACNAWLTDSTDDSNRGAAEGINAMMPLVSILVVFGGFMFFDLEQSGSWSIIFAVIGTLVTVVGILGFFLIKEPNIRPVKDSYLGGILYGFRPKTIGENKKLYLAMIGYILFNIAIQIYMPYLIIYYEVTLQMADYVLIMAPAILLAAVFTVFYGRVYDRAGFRKAVVPPMILLMTGYVLLYLFRGTIPVFLGSLLMMCGNLSGGAVFGAMVRDRTPANRSGMFQGLRIFAQVLIPGVVGPAIGAAVLKNAATIVNDDGTSSFVPNADIFLAALAVGILIWVVLFWLFRMMKKEESICCRN